MKKSVLLSLALSLVMTSGAMACLVGYEEWAEAPKKPGGTSVEGPAEWEQTSQK